MQKTNEMKKISFFIIGTFIILACLSLFSFVDAESKAFEKFTGMYIKTETAKPGDKIYVELYIIGDKSNTSITANFGEFTVDLKDVNSNSPYFILPSNVKVGTRYEMYYINVKDQYGTITYSTNQGLSNYANCLDKKYVTVKANEVKNNEITLESFSLNSTTNVFNMGDKLPLNIKTTGNVEFANLTFYNKNLNKVMILYVNDFKTSNPYVILKGITTNGIEDVNYGDYVLTNIYLSSKDSLNNICYTNQSSIEKSKPLNYNIMIQVKDPNTKPANIIKNEVLYKLTLKSTVAKKNEKVYVDFLLNPNIKYKSIMLSFSNDTNEKNMTVYVKDLNGKPYFTIPYTVDPTNYLLTYVLITDENGKSYHYSLNASGYEGSITQFDFKCNLKVEADEVAVGNDNILYLDNDKITTSVIAKLASINPNIIITIDANKDSIIKSDVFNAIKGSNKTILIKYNDNEWVFNGNDIKELKNIDVSLNIVKTNDSDKNDLTQMLKTGLILNFPSNGELPGKTLVRIKATESIIKYLGEKPAYVYYYDENGKKLDKVAIEIKLTEDGYYEFYINHNSTYILTTEKPDDKYISENTTYLQLNNNSNNTESNSLTATTDNKLMDYYKNNSTIIIIMGSTIVILLIIVGAFIISRARELKKMK